MKKILLATVFAAGSFVMFAQDKTTNQTNPTNTTDPVYSTNSTGTYNAYGVPDYVIWDLRNDYPDATDIMWQQGTTDWYHGYFLRNGRYTNMYYSTDPYYNVQYYPERVTGVSVALPVLQTYVPDDVVNTAVNMYKQNLYDITAMKGSDRQDIYQVRILENGQVRSVYMDPSGASVTDIYWKEPEMNMNMQNNLTTTDANAAMDNSNMNTNTKTKTKTIYSDGTKVIQKTKNGKTKVKTSNNTQNDQY
jgi:hypothetical protein